MMGRDEKDARLLLAIREARSAAGFVGESVFGRPFSDRDILSILKAPGLPIRLAARLRDAELKGQFDKTETSTGLAGAAVCDLVLVMHTILGMRRGKKDQLKAERAAEVGRRAKTKRLASTLASLEQVLRDGDTETQWNKGKIDLPFEDYVRATAEFARRASVLADYFKLADERRRKLKHHPDGSAQERFIRDYLVPTFDDIYGHRKRGFARVPVDDSPTGELQYGPCPLLAFVSAYYSAAGQLCPLPETIHKALRPSTKHRKDTLKQKRAPAAAASRAVSPGRRNMPR